MLMGPPAKKERKRKQKLVWRTGDPGAQPPCQQPKASGRRPREPGGKPQRANKYYLQTGRRSRGGRTMGVWGHGLQRSPTSNKTG